MLPSLGFQPATSNFWTQSSAYDPSLLHGFPRKHIDEINGAYIVGYAIMPNHLHCILNFNEKDFSLNKCIANGKRFFAYEIINRLEKLKNTDTLNLLSSAVTEREKKEGQVHKVLKESFDAKAIFSDKFMDQKLNYMHFNPVSGKWQLVSYFTDYEHSSASFYELGLAKHFIPVHYKDL